MASTTTRRPGTTRLPRNWPGAAPRVFSSSGWVEFRKNDLDHPTRRIQSSASAATHFGCIRFGASNCSNQLIRLQKQPSCSVSPQKVGGPALKQEACREAPVAAASVMSGRNRACHLRCEKRLQLRPKLPTRLPRSWSLLVRLTRCRNLRSSRPEKVKDLSELYAVIYI